MIRVRASIDMHGTDDKLRAMSLRAHDFVPVFEKARLSLGRYNAENFTTGGLPVGGWAPRQEVAFWPLMIKTGELMGSLTSLTGPPNVIRPMSATFGTAVEYAKFHQSGTRRMPSRQIVFEPKGWAAEIARDAASHIVNGVL